jgi:hypothetical protein
MLSDEDLSGNLHNVINLDGLIPSTHWRILEDYDNKWFAEFKKRLYNEDDPEHKEAIEILKTIKFKRFYVLLNHHVYVGDFSHLLVDSG